MREGAYGKKPNLIKRILSTTDDVTQQSVHSLIGQKALGGVVGLVLKVAIAAGAAYVASQVAIGIGATIIIGGAVKLYRDFCSAKEMGRETIEEWNHMGQYVRGTRSDLCRLRDAFLELRDIKGYLPEGSQQSPEEIRQILLERVADERKRVKIVKVSDPKASTVVYSLPTVEYDFDFNNKQEYPDGPPKLSGLTILPSWKLNSQRTNADPILSVVPKAADVKELVNPMSIAKVIPVSAAASASA